MCPMVYRDEFWTTDQDLPLHHSIYTAISRDRFKELEASLHISDPHAGGDIYAQVCAYMLGIQLLANCIIS